MLPQFAPSLSIPLQLRDLEKVRILSGTASCRGAGSLKPLEFLNEGFIHWHKHLWDPGTSFLWRVSPRRQGHGAALRGAAQKDTMPLAVQTLHLLGVR